MANYTDSRMLLVLPNDNVSKLVKLFKNDSKDHLTFKRTQLIDIEEVTKNDKLSLVKVKFECAWSVFSCMIKKNEGYLSLKEMVNDLDVENLFIYSTESGVGFEESFSYDKNTDYQFRCCISDGNPDVEIEEEKMLNKINVE